MNATVRRLGMTYVLTCLVAVGVVFAVDRDAAGGVVVLDRADVASTAGGCDCEKAVTQCGACTATDCTKYEGGDYRTVSCYLGTECGEGGTKNCSSTGSGYCQVTKIFETSNCTNSTASINGPEKRTATLTSCN